LVNAKKNAEIEGVAHKITFLNMDALNISFEKDKFDVVICAFIFSHLWRYKSNLYKNISSVLKQNGKLLIIDNYVCLTYILLSTPHLFLYSILKKTKATYLTLDNWINSIIEHKIKLVNVKAKRGILTVIGQQINE
jgi:ubiquinone/menaquinone biosynthesis C-methylase UbiE